MQKKQRSKSLQTGREKRPKEPERYGIGWEIRNTFIEWEEGTRSEEEEIYGAYLPWGEETEEGEDNQSSFEFGSTIKMFMEETKEEGKKGKPIWWIAGGISTQDVIPTVASNTENETVRAYDKADPR